MKFRMGFVTNSSSSSFICLKLSWFWEEDFLRENNLSIGKVNEMMDNGRCDDIPLKDGMLEVILGEDGYQFIAWMLNESDLENESLKSLRNRLIEKIKETYGINLSDKNFSFEYGEIER